MLQERGNPGAWQSSLMRATVPASVGVQLNDFFKKIIQFLLKALTR